jgi:hypothetical protein
MMCGCGLDLCRDRTDVRFLVELLQLDDIAAELLKGVEDVLWGPVEVRRVNIG